MRTAIGSKRAAAVRRAALQVLESLESRRMLSAGDLDAAFGNAGIVVTNFDGPTTDNVQQAIHLNSGKTLATGTSDGRQLLTRYDASGSLDASFGSGGVLYIDP